MWVETETIRAASPGRRRPAAPRAHAEAPEPDPDAIAQRLLRLAAGLAIVAATVATFGSIANHYLLADAISDLNPELEGNLLTWVTVVATFTGALAAAVHAITFSARRRRFFALAATLGFLSLDDGIRLHERVGDAIGLFENVETVIFTPLYAVAFLIIWAYAREVFTRAGILLRLGLMLLLAAVVVDLGSAVTSALEEHGTAWPHAIQLAVEEGLEVSGWILVSATLMTLLCVALVSPAGAPASRRDRAISKPFE